MRATMRTLCQVHRVTRIIVHRITFTFLLCAGLLCGAAVLTSGCGHGITPNTVAGTIANATGIGSGTTQLGQLQVLTGDLNADLFRALMSIRAGLVQLSVAAQGDPILTAIANQQIARFNAGVTTLVAEVQHFQALFGVIGAAVNEGVALQGKPVDWNQLTPVPLVGAGAVGHTAPGFAAPGFAGEVPAAPGAPPVPANPSTPPSKPPGE